MNRNDVLGDIAIGADLNGILCAGCQICQGQSVAVTAGVIGFYQVAIGIVDIQAEFYIVCNAGNTDAVGAAFLCGEGVGIALRCVLCGIYDAGVIGQFGGRLLSKDQKRIRHRGALVGNMDGVGITGGKVGKIEAFSVAGIVVIGNLLTKTIEQFDINFTAIGDVGQVHTVIAVGGCNESIAIILTGVIEIVVNGVLPILAFCMMCLW